MHKCLFAIGAETALMDHITKQISMINLLEEVIPAGFPFALYRLALVFYLSREVEDSETPDMRVRLTFNGNPVGQEYFPVSVDFDNKPRTRAVFTIQGVPFDSHGVFLATLMNGEESIGQWEMFVSPPPLTTG